MNLVTWNVNSIRARAERVHAWIAAHRPDVICLQELKCEDAQFPRADYEKLGYHVATHGQRTYNGVAILSQAPLEDVRRGFGDGGDDSHSRFITARTHGLVVACAYVPNGQAPGTEKYAFKMAWYERLFSWLERNVSLKDPVALAGDWNVAPEEIDVHDPARWEGKIHFSEPERDKLRRLMSLGWVDVFRTLNPTAKEFTWWDYRMLSFPKGWGLRIDHVFASPPLAKRAITSWIDREERKGAGASDHAPLGTGF